MAASNFLGARDIQRLGLLGQPGAVANNYGFSTDPSSRDYILGDRWLGRFQREAVAKGVTSGGNKDILKKLRSIDRNQGFFDSRQQSLLNTFLNTGRAPAGLDPQFAINAYDWAIRGTSRPKSPGLLGSLAKGLIGPVIGSIALPGLGTALGLSVGAGVGGAVGGAIQGGLSGGPLGALRGALSGYGIGSGIAALRSKLPGLFTLNRAANANAVPGLSTGVTTPTGGGLVGSGQLNPSPIGIAGGAPLGASPLAIAGGATALPGVRGLPTGGRIPGTNQIVGTPRTTPTSFLDRARSIADSFDIFRSAAGAIAQPSDRLTLGPGFELQSTTGALSGGGSLLPLGGVNVGGFALPDRIQAELDNPFPVFGTARGIRFPQRLTGINRIRAFNEQARGGRDTARTVEQVRRNA